MYDTFVLTSWRSVLMQSCAAGAILMASLPIARTDLRTKSTSISVAYLLHVSRYSAELCRIDPLSQLRQHLLNILLGR
jgi:hypothetical protein